MFSTKECLVVGNGINRLLYQLQPSLDKVFGVEDDVDDDEPNGRAFDEVGDGFGEAAARAAPVDVYDRADRDENVRSNPDDSSPPYLRYRFVILGHFSFVLFFVIK